MNINLICMLLILVAQSTQGALKSCDPPCLYVTNKTSVFRMSLKNSTGIVNKVQVLYETTGHIRSLAIDEENKHIYWGDFKYHAINRNSLDGSDRKPLFEYAIGYPQGLAVDTSSNILYWTDSLMDRIELSDTNGRYRKVLFKLDKDSEPRGIAVNSVLGYLFWTDWGKRPRIERSTLSGANRTEIVNTKLKWPNDLAVDYKNNRLHWVDAGNDLVESVNFDGSDRRVEHVLTYHEKVVHPYSMAFSAYLNTTYLTDWHIDAILAITKLSFTSETVLIYKNSNAIKQIGQVRILENVTENASKPCISADNKCSHLCLKTTNNQHECACPTGMALVPTNKDECENVKRDYEIYFADSYAQSVNHLIKYVNEDGFKIRSLPVPSKEVLGFPVALDYDPIQKYIYWTDRLTKKTYRMQEDGSKYQVIIEAEHGASFGLAVDKISQVIYWFSQNGKALMMSSIDGIYNATVFTDLLHQPRDIALYEEKGYIYFTEYGYKYIGRINTDGSGAIKWFGSRVSATGIAIDKIEDRVYWCDNEQYSIVSSDLNFNALHTVIQKTVYFERKFWLIENYGNVVSPFSIAILGEKIFWTDTYKRAIFSADKRSGDNIEFVTGGLDHPRDMHVYRDDVLKIEYRRHYEFSYRRNASTNFIVCYPDSQCVSSDGLYAKDQHLLMCPPNYRQTKSNSTCANLSDPIGARFSARCTNWMTCAHRAYSTFSGCKNSSKFVFIKVLECTQVVKPGLCKYNTPKNCSSVNSCESDDDCNGASKCCGSTSCGRKCTPPIQQSDHPCTAAANSSGCSHFCLAESDTYRCACPDEMHLDSTGKICKPGKGTTTRDVCAAPMEHGPCHPLKPRTRWYFNETRKICKHFTYGDCGGNENNFPTEEKCKLKCGVFTPPETTEASSTTKVPKTTQEPNTTQEHSTTIPMSQSTTSATTTITEIDTTASVTTTVSEDTTASVTTRKSSTGSQSCTPNPCKNGGTCGVKEHGYKCNCPKYFHGSNCNTNTVGYSVTAIFTRMKKDSKSVTREMFTDTISAALTKWCELPASDCKFVPSVVKGRRRRLSEPILTYYISEDILIDDFDDNENGLVVVFSVFKSKYNGGVNGFLDKSSIIAAIKKYTGDFKNDLGRQYSDPAIAIVGQQGSTKKTTKIAIAVVFVVLIAFVVTGLVYWYTKKRKQEKKPDNAGTSVHWSFENQLYDDLYPNNVSLPATVGKDATNRSFANPTYNVPNERTLPPPEFGAVGGYAVPVDEKKGDDSKEWVTFENETKAPVNDFIEAQFGDPYKVELILNEQPPDYTSRAGTPAQANRYESRSVSVTSLGHLPDYTSRVGTPGLADIPGDLAITAGGTMRQDPAAESFPEVIPKQITGWKI